MKEVTLNRDKIGKLFMVDIGRLDRKGTTSQSTMLWGSTP